jgi:FlaG/FlaF family flagellin (archaellin)
MRAPTVFVLGFFVSVLFGNSESLSAVSEQTQTVSGGGVTVTVTYLAQTAHESRFSVVLDTHSVNLDAYDLKALSVLRDDTGRTMEPTGAENKGSGHHREIILTFPWPSLNKKWLELVIKDIAGAKERTFRWDRQ